MDGWNVIIPSDSKRIIRARVRLAVKHSCMRLPKAQWNLAYLLREQIYYEVIKLHHVMTFPLNSKPANSNVSTVLRHRKTSAL